MDTGSTYTAVPRELLQRLGVPVERSLPSETADGRIVPVDVGRTTFRLEGLQFHTPVIFAEEGEPCSWAWSACKRLPWPSTPWQDGSYPQTCCAFDEGDRKRRGRRSKRPMKISCRTPVRNRGNPYQGDPASWTARTQSARPPSGSGHQDSAGSQSRPALPPSTRCRST